MKPLLETWTIVIVGKWNVNIFSPDWVSMHLFDKKEGDQIKLELQVGSDFSMRLLDEDILIYPLQDKLIIGVANNNEETLDRATNISKKVLSILSHTPIRAIGINFGFTFDDELDKLTTLFALSDNSSFATGGYQINESSIRRSINHQDEVINFSITRNEHYVFDFNFHRDVQSSSDALAAIDDGFRPRLAVIKDVCKNVYNIDI